MFQFYIKNEMIISKNMHADIIKPDFLAKILRNRHTGFTLWVDFTRKPEYKERERYFCVLNGTEEFRLVSPVHKHEIYSGVLERYPPNETPINFFRPVNTTDYPLFDYAKVLTVEVEKGQCLFVPAFYFMQSQTVTDKSTIVTFEYESHSELVALLFKAIDKGILKE